MRKLLYPLGALILIILIRNATVSILSLKKDETTLINLKKQLDEEKKTNEFYTQRLIYVKKNEFVESEARNKLNLTRPGEFVIVGSEIDRNRLNNGEFDYNKPNWKKWYEMFF